MSRSAVPDCGAGTDTSGALVETVRSASVVPPASSSTRAAPASPSGTTTLKIEGEAATSPFGGPRRNPSTRAQHAHKTSGDNLKRNQSRRDGNGGGGTRDRSSVDLQRSTSRSQPKPLVDLTPQYREPPQHFKKGKVIDLFGHRLGPSGFGYRDSKIKIDDEIARVPVQPFGIGVMVPAVSVQQLQQPLCIGSVHDRTPTSDVAFNMRTSTPVIFYDAVVPSVHVHDLGARIVDHLMGIARLRASCVRLSRMRGVDRRNSGPRPRLIWTFVAINPIRRFSLEDCQRAWLAPGQPAKPASVGRQLNMSTA